MLAGPEPMAGMAHAGEASPSAMDVVREESAEPLTLSSSKDESDPERSPATVLDSGEPCVSDEKIAADDTEVAEAETVQPRADNPESCDVCMTETGPAASQEDSLNTPLPEEADVVPAASEDQTPGQAEAEAQPSSTADPEVPGASTSLPSEDKEQHGGERPQDSCHPEENTEGDHEPTENEKYYDAAEDHEMPDTDRLADTLKEPAEGQQSEQPAAEVALETDHRMGVEEDQAAPEAPAPSATHEESNGTAEQMDVEDTEARCELEKPSPGKPDDDNGEKHTENNSPDVVQSPPGSPTPRKGKKGHQPRMKRTKRCGHCHTCVNPQLKKACLTARSQQAEQKGKGNEAPSSATEEPPKSPEPLAKEPAVPPAPLQAQPRVPPQPQPTAPAPRASSQAELADKLRPLLSPKGGVEDPKKFGSFQQLMQNEMSLKGRHLFLTIVEMTASVECLQIFVARDGLGTLNQWLAETRDRGNAKAEAGAGAEAKNIWDLSKKIIGVLTILPVDIDAVLKVGIGKTVRSLKGPHVSAEVKTAAKELVAQWKHMFIDKPVPAPADGASKRERDSSGRSGQSAKKAKKEAEKGQDAGSSLSLMEANDDSLFKPVPKAAPKMKPAAPRRKVQKLTEPILVGSPDNSPLSSPTGTSGPDQADAKGEPEPSAPNGEDKPSPEDLPKSSITAIGRGSPVSNASQAPVTVRIGVPNINPGIKTAARRAAEAAARIPDEAPEYASREKKKSVRWVEDDNMRQIRLFWKDQPPIAVKGELNASGDDMDNIHQDGFESAAKREHLLERQAMEHGRSQGPEMVDGAVEPDSPSKRSPSQVQWTPPRLVLLEPVDTGSGEESKEKGSQAMRERSTPPGSFPGGVSRTFSPAEALPLSVEEQQSLRTHRPKAIPFSLPPAPQEPTAMEYSMQMSAPPATSAPQQQQTVVTPLLQAMVSHLDPALLNSLKAITSSGPDADPQGLPGPPMMQQPGGSRGAARPHSGGGWSNGFSSGPPSSVPMGTSSQGPWPGSMGPGGNRSGSGFSGGPSDWVREVVPRPDGWGSGGQRGGPRPGPAPGSNQQGPGHPGDWGVRRGGNGGSRESGWDRGREGWRDVPPGGHPPLARSSSQNYPPAPPAPFRPPAPAPSSKPCLFFNSPQGCRNGDKCKFAHVRKNLSQAELTDALSAISKAGVPPRASRW